MSENERSEIELIKRELAGLKRWQKLKRRLFAVFAVIGIPLVIYSASVIKPFTFTAGTEAKSEEVNSNFDTLYTKVNELDAAGGSSVPTGTIIAYGASTAPTSWLLCDGSQVSRTTYADLFGKIGTTFGTGDGTTTFHLPDFRGRFLRGRDASSGNDPDAAGRTAMNTGGNTGDSLGSVQADSIKSHNHNLKNSGSDTYVIGVGGVNSGANDATGDGGAVYGTTASSGGNETRPKNAYVNFIIKY